MKENDEESYVLKHSKVGKAMVIKIGKTDLHNNWAKLLETDEGFILIVGILLILSLALVGIKCGFSSYGLPAYALGLFTICAYQMLRYKENLPNPIVHFYSLFILRTQKWWETILRVVSLVAYGFLVQRKVIT
ncbi:unnamed protein product [Lepeophtheirus salmonis]|uniref:(salmon louse) hypothetical protein n=1 Tax=Lepeophtheirus salmonis TaxID=72036 RepID=A0A7R8CLB9_LEPSM|nr:unnamed protein product [Lepeophtheirus salmonis]CAF2855137.1 unnamed protein product [Lepeophtheirus salmonis]